MDPPMASKYFGGLNRNESSLSIDNEKADDANINNTSL